MEPKKKAQTATSVLLAGNTFLLILKTVVGLISGSIALMSDAINSFSDLIVSFIIFLSVKVSQKAPDKTHPFGHHRAQPIAALVVAIFTTILGFEIIKLIFEKVFFGKIEIIGSIALAALAITIVVKFLMWVYLKKVALDLNSPAIKASAIDCKNDVLIDLAAIVGVFGATQGYLLLDPIAGFVISVYVIRAGYGIAKENIDYLVGKTPSKKLIEKIKSKALSIPSVQGLNEVKAHYIGNYVQVEVHIELDKNLPLIKAHDIGKKVEREVESLEEVTNCFVHIDPK